MIFNQPEHRVPAKEIADMHKSVASKIFLVLLTSGYIPLHSAITVTATSWDP